jgi:hypothetical protein
LLSSQTSPAISTRAPQVSNLASLSGATERQEDRRRDAGRPAGIGDRQSVIAAGCGDYTAPQPLPRQRERRVYRTPGLERAADLQRLEFQHNPAGDIGVVPGRRRGEQWRPPYKPADARGRGADLLYPWDGVHGAQPVRKRISKVAGMRPSGRPNRSE